MRDIPRLPAFEAGCSFAVVARLASLGWRSHFAAQLDPGSSSLPARVLEVHRGRLEVAGEELESSIELSGHSATLPITVGDWVLLDAEGQRVLAVLERFSAFRRGSAGTARTIQLIAANVDTVFIVTSANRDFNVARLERYLAIAKEAGAFPVVVITKIDTAESAEAVATLVHAAEGLSAGLLVEAINALDTGDAHRLRDWCGEGQTIALLGSSGVGKSTLINQLARTSQHTQGARDSDQRGRHTTTSRSMHRLPDGGWLIDTPGMRELQLVDVADALDEVFDDIARLAKGCRFADCSHGDEPGCAIRRAIDSGDLDAERLRRYRKLVSENRRNSESLAERRARDRSMGKLYRSAQSGKRRLRGDSDEI